MGLVERVFRSFFRGLVLSVFAVSGGEAFVPVLGALRGDAEVDADLACGDGRGGGDGGIAAGAGLGDVGTGRVWVLGCS